MALDVGSRLGLFEVTGRLGEGGMGVVYRATDTTLHRDVALKVLPDAFAQDAERLARFQREAQVLASLNHPNIAQIHGLEQSGDTRALVLELVEGPTLQDRITKGPIPLDEALPIARQIAEALEAAHELGIIHRDLKPANVKVKDDGTVKVLDFGLAKALGPDLSDTEAANSPTMTMTAAATKMGVIMGTAAYMSPEQAAGKQVDRRADIWAFGVVLWEMLTGCPLFTGETLSHVLASVLKTDPDWAALPSTTPAPVRRLLRRSLNRNPRERLQHVGDARVEIREALTAPATDEVAHPAIPPAVSWRRALPWAAAFVTGAALAAIAIGAFVGNTATPRPTPRRFRVVVPSGVGNALSTLSARLSPDGSRFVYATEGGLHLRNLEELEATPIPDSEGGRDPLLARRSTPRIPHRHAAEDGRPERGCAEDCREPLWWSGAHMDCRGPDHLRPIRVVPTLGDVLRRRCRGAAHRPRGTRSRS